MNVKDRVKQLRQLMKNKGLDAYIIPSYDAHLSEYVADHYKCREWISGFTGSAGTVVVTMEDAGLWTDGRYYIQAADQLEDSGIRLFKAAEPQVPSYRDWLLELLPEGSRIGLDGHVFPANMVKEMGQVFQPKNISIHIDDDLIGEIWTNRPPLPATQIFLHEVKYAGKSRIEKLEEVREKMKAKGADVHLLTSLDDIAWLLNIRGNDVPNNPVTIANTVVCLDKCYLFVDPAKLSKSVKDELQSEGITLCDYGEIQEFLAKLTEDNKILLDPAAVSASLYNSIPENVAKVEALNVTTQIKAIKNPVEIDNLKDCHIRDCVAMVKFIKWLKESVAQGATGDGANAGEEEITEISLAERLEEFRREDELYVGPSFDTIAAYKDHAAMMHYKATEESNYIIKNEGFLLVDSGGQYYNGTTDITRTFVMGTLTEEERTDFTLVLKGHISLSTTHFLHGSTGHSLDVLARAPIWKRGLDYKCGTGHGVGFFLNVHEGPQRLSQVLNDTVLEEGMILTNEPGIYREGKHGIRTENTMLVKHIETTEFGQFMGFETISFCPIDLQGIDSSLLTPEEIRWLNAYHKAVYDKLSPYLDEDVKAWLKQETRKI
jgi:Xaa-Pro aminopeptidase